MQALQYFVSIFHLLVHVYTSINSVKTTVLYMKLDIQNFFLFTENIRLYFCTLISSSRKQEKVQKPTHTNTGLI